MSLQTKKMDADKQAYKTRGAKIGSSGPVGKMESHPLEEGQHNCANGNDGSKSQPSAPENKHKLEKYK
jgi:hypothetical protein